VAVVEQRMPVSVGWLSRTRRLRPCVDGRGWSLQRAAAFGAELPFTFVVGYVVFSCIESSRDALNSL
jgi:hypothetical protein